METGKKAWKQLTAFLLAVCLIVSPMSLTQTFAATGTVTITLDSEGGSITGENGASYGETVSEVVVIADMEAFWNKINQYYEIASGNKNKRFIGWHLPQENEAATLDSLKSYAQTHNTFRLIALYETIYTVDFVTNGGTFEDGESDKSVTVPKGTAFSKISKPVKKEGYTFYGWFSEKNEIIPGNTAINTDFTARAVLMPDHYNVAFSKEGKIVEGADRKVLFDSPYGSVFPNVEKEAYDLKGWYTSEGEDAEQVSAESFVKIAKDHTLYAVYTPHEYQIAYDLKGGKLENAVTGYNVEQKNDIKVGRPVKKGYDFTGWNVWFAGSVSMNGIMDCEIASQTKKDVKLTAEYKPVVYQIKYQLDGAGLEKAVETYTVEDKDIVIGAPEKTGYDFTGWKELTKEGEKDYAGFVVIDTERAEDITLAAQFKPHVYRIIYSLNGGTLKNAVSEYTVSSNAIKVGQPQKEGYTFEGWTVVEGGSISENTVMSYQVDPALAKNITLIAEWKKTADQTEGGNGTESGETSVSGNTSGKEDPSVSGNTTEGGNSQGEDKPQVSGNTIPINQADNTEKKASSEEQTPKGDGTHIGDIVEVASALYKTTGVSVKDGKAIPTEVTYEGCKNNKITSVVIPDTVRINGVAVRVTKIAARAFIGFDRLKKVTIGSYITHIGNQAFYGCEKLKTIKVKSKVLKKVGSKSFKYIHAKAKFKVPKSKKKVQRKKFFKKKVGYVKTWKIK